MKTFRNNPFTSGLSGWALLAIALCCLLYFLRWQFGFLAGHHVALGLPISLALASLATYLISKKK